MGQRIPIQLFQALLDAIFCATRRRLWLPLDPDASRPFHQLRLLGSATPMVISNDNLLGPSGNPF